MLTFKLISFKDGVYHYEIYPEGKEENKGWIKFNPIEKKVIEKKEPKGSFDYIAHFANNVQDENGNYKKEGMAAWY
ncbi:MAG: hypothetical protein Q4E37_01405 [Tissierellia bacterium]|nr:hypothetical protein [Tissierellia bacterium]